MEFEFDCEKDRINRQKHGISLAAAERMDFDTARIRKDERRDYQEPRWLAAGLIGDRLHMLAFTMRGETLRVISLRKANRRERRDYDRG
jgi:uncharacterized DUF497 family protein